MINEYSYGHLMILEISSDQQKRPAGLIKRETGVNPVRSRHCDRELQNIIDHWDGISQSGKGFWSEELKSGDLLANDQI